MKRSGMTLILASLLASITAHADTAGGDTSSEEVATVQMRQVTETGPGESLGEVSVHKSEHGLIFTPSLASLTPGMHGFHVHENPSCEPSKKNGDVTPGGAAGGHYDPDQHENHGAPWGDGHRGDLPALYVDQDGAATHAVLAPRLKEEDLKDASLMIHANGDNYSDQPEALGGGGPRVACGVFEK